MRNIERAIRAYRAAKCDPQRSRDSWQPRTAKCCATHSSSGVNDATGINHAYPFVRNICDVKVASPISGKVHRLTNTCQYRGQTVTVRAILIVAGKSSNRSAGIYIAHTPVVKVSDPIAAVVVGENIDRIVKSSVNRGPCVARVSGRSCTCDCCDSSRWRDGSNDVISRIGD